MDRILREHKGEVELTDDFEMEGRYSLRSIKPGVQVGKLLKDYKVETLREHRLRSRDQINRARKQGRRI